jgi:hypothetical protein
MVTYLMSFWFEMASLIFVVIRSRSIMVAPSIGRPKTSANVAFESAFTISAPVRRDEFTEDILQDSPRLLHCGGYVLLVVLRGGHDNPFR